MPSKKAIQKGVNKQASKPSPGYPKGAKGKNVVAPARGNKLKKK